MKIEYFQLPKKKQRVSGSIFNLKFEVSLRASRKWLKWSLKTHRPDSLQQTGFGWISYLGCACGTCFQVFGNQWDQLAVQWLFQKSVSGILRKESLDYRRSEIRVVDPESVRNNKEKSWLILTVLKALIFQKTVIRTELCWWVGILKWTSIRLKLKSRYSHAKIPWKGSQYTRITRRLSAQSWRLWEAFYSLCGGPFPALNELIESMHSSLKAWNDFWFSNSPTLWISWRTMNWSEIRFHFVNYNSGRSFWGNPTVTVAVKSNESIPTISLERWVFRTCRWYPGVSGTSRSRPCPFLSESELFFALKSTKSNFSVSLSVDLHPNGRNAQQQPKSRLKHTWIVPRTESDSNQASKRPQSLDLSVPMHSKQIEWRFFDPERQIVVVDLDKNRVHNFFERVIELW